MTAPRFTVITGSPQPVKPVAPGQRFTPIQLPAGCSGDCLQGQRDCTCGRALGLERCGMWDDERGSPWKHALAYGLVMLWVVLASRCTALVGPLWGGA